jgi:hypothetical protein
MNIQNIKVIDSDTIIITTTDGKTMWFEKHKLEGPHRTWFDNILACSESLVIETSRK